MVNIEQVRLLEQRVQKVISRLAELRAENTDLRERLGVYQDRIEELEERVNSFSSNQAEIEQGILNALHQLDEVEDAVTGDGGESHTVIVEEPLDDSGEDQPDADEIPAEAVSDTPDGDPEDEAEPEAGDDSEEQPPESGPELDIF
jgi:chromosome segregation ATPase